MPPSARKTLPLVTKFAYGVGIVSIVVPDVILTIFFLYFLTDIVGLRPVLAGTVLLIGRLWDAANDLLVGWLSDRTQSAWGRRYPWMVIGIVPLALFLGLLWWVPPVENQRILFGYYCLMLILYDSALTAVLLPYNALAAELTQDYRDRTQLISFQSFFRTGGIILVLLLAQIVFARVPDQQQYWVLALLCGVGVMLAIGICIGGTYRQYQVVSQPLTQSTTSAIKFWPQFKRVLSDLIFWRLLGIYLCSWLAIQVMASIVPYFVVTYMGQTAETVTTVILIAQLAALLMVVVWGTAGLRLDKHHIYLIAIPLWILALVFIMGLQPDQTVWLYGLMILAGSGAAAAYIVPWAMLPDVIDYQELRSGQRSEGMYYGVMVWMQKLGVAVALFGVGLCLDWAGFVSAVDSTQLSQPPSAILTIRGIMGLVPTVLLIGSLLLAYRYPITRQAHAETRLLLSQQRQS
ncbi:MAG: MFS transporter [Elainellaceae cyanobacterium]